MNRKNDLAVTCLSSQEPVQTTEEKIASLQTRVWVITLFLSTLVIFTAAIARNLNLWGILAGAGIGLFGFQLLVFTVTTMGRPGKSSYGKAFLASGCKMTGMVFLFWLFNHFGSGLFQMVGGLLIAQFSIILAIVTIWEKPRIQTVDRSCTI